MIHVEERLVHLYNLLSSHHHHLDPAHFAGATTPPAGILSHASIHSNPDPHIRSISTPDYAYIRLATRLTRLQRPLQGGKRLSNG